MKLNVIVEDYVGNKYQATYETPTIVSRTQAKKELNQIIESVLEEFENDTRLTITLFNHIVVYKNGKTYKPYTLYTCGEKYQNLVNYYNAILN